MGTLTYYPNQAGPYQSTATDTKDWLKVKESYDQYNLDKAAWETTNTAYNLLRTAYNAELEKERLRNEDFLGMLFLPPFPIPQRPCAPDTFPAYDGLKIVYDNAVAFSAWTTQKTDKSAIFTDNSSVKAAINSWRQGYLSPSTDATAGSQTIAMQQNVAHIYGRLGQGAAVGDPNSATNTVKAYQWTSVPTTKTHHLMFSILPYDRTDTGLTGAAELKFKAKIVAWDTTLETLVV